MTMSCAHVYTVTVVAICISIENVWNSGAHVWLGLIVVIVHG